MHHDSHDYNVDSKKRRTVPGWLAEELENFKRDVDGATGGCQYFCPGSLEEKTICFSKSNARVEGGSGCQ